MSLLSRLWNAIIPGRKVDEPAPTRARVFRFGAGAAGIAVNADTALKNATVWACVTYLSRTVAQLPWRVMRESDSGETRVPWHPVEQLLHRRANPEMGAFSFREVMVGWAVRYGNAVAEIQRDARGVPVALWPIHPARVQFERDAETGELLYQVTDNAGGRSTLRSMEVYHLRGYGEGPVGLDVVAYAAESIGWAQATELFGATFFGNGAHTSGFLTYPGKLGKDTKDLIEDELKAKHGQRNSNGVMILDAAMKFEKSTEAPENAQFIETRQHQVEEICRWFGVPPHKVMHMLRATFTNIEHQSIEVVVDSITPWAIRNEQEADYKLFGQNRQSFYTKMDLKGLLRGDFKSRQEGLQIMRRNGVINANTWRRLEDMDEIGRIGDKYIVEGNMTTLEAVGQPKPTPAPAPRPAEEENDTDPSIVEQARRQAARALH
jgi:HK97 family phage portal protein